MTTTTMLTTHDTHYEEKDVLQKLIYNKKDHDQVSKQNHIFCEAG